MENKRIIVAYVRFGRPLQRHDSIWVGPQTTPPVASGTPSEKTTERTTVATR